MRKLLIIDIGNTNIVLSCYHNSKCVSFDRIKSKEKNVIDNLKNFLKNLDFNCSVLSSVVPYLTEKVSNSVEETGVKPLIVNKEGITGLIKESLPEELGSDILCNLIAAHYYFPDEFVTVADFGTAFTTSTVSPSGEFMGVTISPGMMTSVKALFQNTAQLPQIKLDLPETVLGKNTIDSIRAGVLYGFVGQVEAIVNQIEMELENTVKLILTGGLSKYVMPYIKKISKSDVKFTIEGAKIFYELNVKDESK